MKWEKGRQNSGYDKLKLFESQKLKCDCYLLHYPTGSEIKPHTDKVDLQYDHYRLNFVLHKAKKGGIFKCDNVLFKLGRLVVFRPDQNEHSVTQIEEGTRLVFSFGWLRHTKSACNTFGGNW